jgi:serine/threonine protein kinase
MRDDLASAPAPGPDLPDRLQVGELLGRGGVAEVYRAHDRLLDRPVAVKVFHPHTDPAARRRFDAEAYALARLGHPGLVSIFDIGSAGDRPYLVMQLIDGDSLATRLTTGPLSTPTVAEAGAVLAGALAHAHDRGVVHRDVKPSNILVDQDENPHLTDFGIALLTGEDRLTSANEVIGTPAYVAPEQLLGEGVGPAVDVYALGLVLLECLTGEMEYAGGTRLETALARLHRPPRIPDGLPAELTDLMAAMTDRDPAGRPSADQCAARLSAVRTDRWQPIPLPRRPPIVAEPTVVVATESAADPTVVRASPATPSRLRRPLAVAGVAAAAAVAGVVLVLTVSHPTTGQTGPAAASQSPSHNPPAAGQPAQAAAPATGPGSGRTSAPVTLVGVPVADGPTGTNQPGPPAQAAGSAPASVPVRTKPVASTTAVAPTSQAAPTSTAEPTTTTAAPTTTSTTAPADPTGA